MEFKFEVVEYGFGENLKIISHGVFHNIVDAWYCKQFKEVNDGIVVVNVIISNTIDQEEDNDVYGL